MFTFAATAKFSHNHYVGSNNDAVRRRILIAGA